MSSIYGNLKAKFVIISGGLLTTLRTYTLQNKSGTIALIDDIPISTAQATNLTGGGDSTLHYHATDRALANATGTLSVANGGTGVTTAQAEMNRIAATVTSGQFLRGNDTNVVMSAIQASDIPTPTINAQAGNYTAVLTDANSVTIDMTSASANTFTIPTNASVAFPVGSSLTVFRSGAGVTTIQATTAGVILNGTSGGSRLIEGQYQGVLLQKKATDTWYIFNK